MKKALVFLTNPLLLICQLRSCWLSHLPILLLIFALSSLPAWASPDPSAAHIASIKHKVADCMDQQKRVVVETYDQRQMLGFISEAGADDFVLSYAGRPTTLAYREVKKIRWPSPLKKEVKRGIVAIVGAAAITGAIFGLLVLFGGLRG